MYAISTNERKYSTTPIVEIVELPNGKTEERFICLVAMPKKNGDKLSAEIVELLNNKVSTVE